MGLISGVLAIREFKKIRMGKKGKLSNFSIYMTNLNTIFSLVSSIFF